MRLTCGPLVVMWAVEARPGRLPPPAYAWPRPLLETQRQSQALCVQPPPISAVSSTAVREVAVLTTSGAHLSLVRRDVRRALRVDKLEYHKRRALAVRRYMVYIVHSDVCVPSV
jgi:hypothetical protein